MKNNVIWLIVALILVVIGAIIFVAVMSANDWDFSRLGTSKLVDNEHLPEGEFESVEINTDTADVIFALAEDGVCRVVCREREVLYHSVTVLDGALKIEVVDQRQWYHHIGMFGKDSITVYLPSVEYESLKITVDTADISVPEGFKFGSVDITTDTGDVSCKADTDGDVKITTDTGDTEYTADVAGKLSIFASTGDISIDGVSCTSASLSVSTGGVNVTGLNCSGDLSIEVSTGKSYINDVKCLNFISTGSTGDLVMNNVVASEKFNIERSTGDVDFDRCDANEIVIKTSTGDVEGVFLTEKIVYAQTSTGKVDVPKSTSGGLCDITTSTGNIKISLFGSCEADANKRIDEIRLAFEK